MENRTNNGFFGEDCNIMFLYVCSVIETCCGSSWKGRRLGLKGGKIGRLGWIIIVKICERRMFFCVSVECWQQQKEILKVSLKWVQKNFKIETFSKNVYIKNVYFKVLIIN